MNTAKEIVFSEAQPLLFVRVYTTVGKKPVDTVTWTKRSVQITSSTGASVFAADEVEFPEKWSQSAATIVASKYFCFAQGSSHRERSAREMITRVAGTISGWVGKNGSTKTKAELEAFGDELQYILLNQLGTFNSPVWFNVGVHERPQCSACFILAIDDNLDSLLKQQQTEARLFKFGSGSGANLSTIRSRFERLSGGGVPSGPVSFMRAFDAWANVIKSGGKTRRAAKMQILNVDHPDILEFIDAKANEERKAWALIEQGYDGGFGVAGGAYDSVGLQNANFSVRVSDEFMNAVSRGEKYWTYAVTDHAPIHEHDAKSVLMKIAANAHLCGDPGLQFDTMINRWHTCPNSGRINSSNPCSEYMHLDNSACNLASINLLPFLTNDGTFEIEEFCHTVHTLLIAQDSLIDEAGYPTEEIAECARNFRQLGLGYANLGALLMSLGLPYDSDAGREWAAVITALLTGQAYLTSAQLAERLGSFSGYAKNREAMLEVVAQHRAALANRSFVVVPARLVEKAAEVWEAALELGRRVGFRNSQVSVLAPTGTISFMMDCDTTGIEPDIALIKYKKLVGGGTVKIVNQSVQRALERLGYGTGERRRIVEFIDQHETIEGAPGVKPGDLAVFDCALKPLKGSRFIGPMGHLKMMAAVQPFLSGAISKTVNMPHETTVQEIFDTYLSAWQMGLKSVALYRDGSKRCQPLNLAASQASKNEQKTHQPSRRRLPVERRSLTHKFTVGGLEGYITVGLFDDGTPGEIFLLVSKEGSTLSGVMDAFATAVSTALQYGVPLVTLIKKFTHQRFEPAGFTGNLEIPSATSIVDYVFQWMAAKFLTAEERTNMGLRVIQPKNGLGQARTAVEPSHPRAESQTEVAFSLNADAPPCTNCGSVIMVRQGGCYVCLNCGSQGGCG